MADKSPQKISHLFKVVAKVEQDEIKAVMVSFGHIFSS